MVRFSKTIQRAIPQKIRRSASMLKCETTPLCYTSKYATIVLRSSGALEHWLVSSVASLGGLARVGAPRRPAELPTRLLLLIFFFCFVDILVFFIYIQHICKWRNYILFAKFMPLFSLLCKNCTLQHLWHIS